MSTMERAPQLHKTKEPDRTGKTNIWTANRPGFDWMLVLIIIVLLVFGLIMLFSASAYNAQIKFGTSYWYVKRQAINTVLGLAIMFGVSFIPMKFWRVVSPFLYAVSLIMVVLVKTSMGVEAYGARRWLDLKFISLQPSEVVKVALVVLMAALLAKNAKNINRISTYALIFGTCLLAAALIAWITDDLGTAVVVFAMGLVMMLVVSPSIKWVLLSIAVVIAAGVILILLEPYRMERVTVWLHLKDYADSGGYQVLQGLYAIGSGGFFGKGLGKGTQKLSFIPEAENDMIFSIVCEELGVLGAILVIALFALLIWRMKKIFDRTKGTFGKVVVAGVATHIGTQAIVNMMVVTGMIPNTGVPLPFISYGGTAVVFLLFEVGLVLSVGRGDMNYLSKLRRVNNTKPANQQMQMHPAPQKNGGQRRRGAYPNR